MTPDWQRYRDWRRKQSDGDDRVMCLWCKHLITNNHKPWCKRHDEYADTINKRNCFNIEFTAEGRRLAKNAK